MPVNKTLYRGVTIFSDGKKYWTQASVSRTKYVKLDRAKAAIDRWIKRAGARRK